MFINELNHFLKFYFQTVIYKASSSGFSGFTDPSTKNRTFHFDIVTKGKGMIAAGQVKKWKDVPFEIPPLPPSGLSGCKSIEIQYQLQVRLFIMSVCVG